MSLRMIKEVLKPRDVATHCSLCGRAFSRFPSDEEHIFPQWMQRKHDLWNRRLHIPNFIGKRYSTVKIRVCRRCNGSTFGDLEKRFAPVFDQPDVFEAVSSLGDDEIAVWLGKIFWLLIRKSHSVVDFRTRDEPEPDRIIPNAILPGTFFLGMIERAYATRKGMVSCYMGDPPFPEFCYGEPYSLYRYRIDTRDGRFEAFDFRDNPAALGVAFRSGNFGAICIFDGGIHRRFRRPHYDFLAGEALHPLQFAEVAARMIYDQTVLDEGAGKVTYYWNRALNSVVAQCHSPRHFNPYLQVNYDPERLAAFVGSHTFIDPAQIMRPDGITISCLHDPNGHFQRFPVTDEELAAHRADPDRVVLGPMDAKWRTKRGTAQ